MIGLDHASRSFEEGEIHTIWKTLIVVVGWKGDGDKAYRPFFRLSSSDYLMHLSKQTKNSKRN